MRWLRAISGKMPAVQQLGHNYLSALEKSSVTERTQSYYRKTVETYISANRDHRLATHTAADVDTYLTAKGRPSSLQEWRFGQIMDALRLSLTCFPQTSWALHFYCDRWQVFAADLQPEQVTLHHDLAPGHADLTTAMFYTHVPKKGGLGVQSP